MALYILHADHQTPSNGVGIFGPFSDEEIKERLNDAYADALASFGAVICIQIDEDADQIYINSREYWMEQLANYKETFE